MDAKNDAGSTEWVDPDDAPELTEDMLRDAELFDGDTFIARGEDIKRGRGRPKSPAAKELVSLRLDPDVLAKLREAGPGWQSRVSGLLRHALAMADAARLPD